MLTYKVIVFLAALALTSPPRVVFPIAKGTKTVTLLTHKPILAENAVKVTISVVNAKFV